MKEIYAYKPMYPLRPILPIIFQVCRMMFGSWTMTINKLDLRNLSSHADLTLAPNGKVTLFINILPALSMHIAFIHSGHLYTASILWKSVISGEWEILSATAIYTARDYGDIGVYPDVTYWIVLKRKVCTTPVKLGTSTNVQSHHGTRVP